MKKTIVGALVGGIIIFLWQFLSWTILDLHRSAQDYTPKQDSIMSYLNTHLDKEGGYAMPTTPKGTSMEECKKVMEQSLGKPWASVQYHKSFKVDMGMNMARGLIVDIFMVGLLCWMLLKISNASFGTVFLGALFTGLIVFLNAPYTMHIWYPSFDLMAHLKDALISWGVCGLWLGWWLRRK